MDNLTIREGFLGQRMIVLPKKIKAKLKTNEIARYFYVTDLGYYPNANHHFRQRAKGAKEYIFIYCTEGEGWLQIGNEKKVKVLPNHYFIIPKNEKHSYGAHHENPWSIYWLHFNGISADTFFRRYDLNSNKVVSIPFSGQRISVFDQIFETLDGGHLDLQMEFACMTSLNFLNTFIYHDISMSINLNNHKNLIDSIKEFLNKNLDKSLSANDIANEFDYSPSYIFSVFKKSTGYSLMYFFNLKKVQKACEYINYSNLSIKEIAYKLSFQDPFYFSRLFKKYMGVSPRLYKNDL
ncbi:AraC family transcriptional regulator [Aggregatimonas sangjinii]|uniref:AraC family transcriptional regulator n=1 Tax=Aggregatimonas sangjinii TaxID=2583587 RepID=A0A5B7SLQ1_9FLAO|nr:AraC family transcriptional regulator [Aggregatimonas sangjinii]QCW99534.1 AraC family transcriptional regulator [Aggregatimonas sangjinii]